MNDLFSEFLPKYPRIAAVDNIDLNPYNGEFYSTLYKKKEFYDLRLQPNEVTPNEPGMLMNHQKIIARYMSSETPYQGLLLFHEMGTGKGCSAIGSIELLKSTGKFKSAYYIASRTLSDNFLNELVYVCTDGRYRSDEEGLTKEQVIRANRKKVSEFISLVKIIRTGHLHKALKV